MHRSSRHRSDLLVGKEVKVCFVNVPAFGPGSDDRPAAGNEPFPYTKHVKRKTFMFVAFNFVESSTQ
jgi:hypothetical protein